MPSPQAKVWNTGFKLATATYDRLAAGVGKLLTNRRIEHYRRVGMYGLSEQEKQLAEDKRKKMAGTKEGRVKLMVDDLAD